MTIYKGFCFKKLPLFCVALLVLNSSCTDGFLEANTNQHEATEKMMAQDNLRTGGFFTQLQRNVVLFEDGDNLSSDYQVAQGLTSDLYSGYIAPTGTWFAGQHNGSYNFISNWISRTFSSGFTGVMPAWQSIVEVANEQGLPEVAALATVVKVEAMHRVADAYGPIPYVSYGSGSLQTSYDALEDIYAKFFEELDESIDVLTNYISGNPGVPILRKYDLVYSGDALKWVKFANTLRLRLAIRVSYVNAGLAQAEAEKAANHIYGVISNANERASLKRSTNLAYHHPLYDIAYNFNDGEARMSASMDSYMNGYEDPRRSAYFVPAVVDGAYHGVRLGITGSVWTPFTGENISNLNVNAGSTEIVWMTAAESYFLRAEGVLRGWDMGGTARDFYESGISISFEENNVSGATNYIGDDTRIPIAFVDNAASHNAPAPSDITVAWEEGASFERNLERIITQKWIAMFPDGPEGWAEFRRTGYPRLYPVVSNNSNGTINTEMQVRRIPYPQGEYNNNRAGVEAGVAKLGGADHGGTKLWWDKK